MKNHRRMSIVLILSSFILFGIYTWWGIKDYYGGYAAGIWVFMAGVFSTGFITFINTPDQDE